METPIKRIKPDNSLVSLTREVLRQNALILKMNAMLLQALQLPKYEVNMVDIGKFEGFSFYDEHKKRKE